MRVVFTDGQDESNPLSGKDASPELLASVYESVRGRQPFVFLLDGDDGTGLTVAVGRDLGCVQWSDADAVARVARAPQVTARKDIEFLLGGTPTPIPPIWLLPMARVQTTVTHYLVTGLGDPSIEWELV